MSLEVYHSSTTLAFSQTTHLVSVRHVLGWYVALLLVRCIFFLCVRAVLSAPGMIWFPFYAFPEPFHYLCEVSDKRGLGTLAASWQW